MWGVFEQHQTLDGRLHVVPIDNDDHVACDHYLDEFCWCNPTLSKEGVVTHNQADWPGSREQEIFKRYPEVRAILN